MRMNALRSAGELHDFLIDEVTELSGAERVLLVLDTASGRQIVGALVPASEDAATLLQAVGPWLDDARDSRVASPASWPRRHGSRRPALVHRRAAARP